MMLRFIVTAYLLLICSFSFSADPLNKLLDQQPAPSAAAQKWDLSVLDEEDEESAIESIQTEEVEKLLTFLPVDEAYQLTITHDSEALTLNWVIADAYFLYGDKFFFKVNGKPVNATLSIGKVSYDEIFEKDVEKHYLFAEAKITGDKLPSNSGFELAVASQGCADAGYCYPPQTRHFFVDGSTITAISAPTASTPLDNTNTGQAPSTPKTIDWAKAIGMLAFAIVGGMILNLMPCVLPVLSLKALSLASSRDDHHVQGWSYTLGVVTTFLLVAGVLLFVRAAGQAVGWGFQLQSPGFITLLIFLFFVMGLSLSGYISIGTRWMSMGQSLTQGSGLKQSYFTGVLAAVVASPCTAPFMASALGYAITQPWWLALSIFGGLGFGMALPLLLLSYLPKLGDWLPKPGAWMETFKQALAFPLYLTAIWLLWVLGRQLGSDAATMIVIACLLIVFIFWLGNHLPSTQRFTGIVALVLVAFFSWNASQQTLAEKIQTASEWEPYSASRLEELRNQGKAVFINMTADWCITCLANEKVVFTDIMIEEMKRKEIHLIKGDWTNYDSAITQLLEKYGRGGVPLYLLFPAEVDAEAQVLPQILRPTSFREKIDSI